MTLSPGTRIGPYEIVALLGQGGMGEVYRATDTKLKRQVALKILPAALRADPDRLARFQREAEILASLNHPHIATIYGLEDAHDITALVIELVEGEDLAARLKHGPIPLDDALAIARQIADALEAAHGHGIIHRDLKPANIKLRPDGTVKVLDFGLAKLTGPGVEASPAGQVLSMSPTIASPARLRQGYGEAGTEAGVILGTAAYMSPEQARGKPIDARADIWAFGCVLYEMLTGTRPFDGDDVMSAIGAAIHKEPQWTALPASTSSAVRATIVRCLQKDPKLRARDIADVRLALDGGFSAHEAPPPAPAARRSAVPLLLAATLVGAVVAGGLVWMLTAPPPAVTPTVVRFPLTAPAGFVFNNLFALSPDGRHLAYLLRDNYGRPSLWLHSFESGESRQLPRGGAVTSSIVWSPDSRFVAFAGPDGLSRMDITGGAPELIAAVPRWAGGDWAPDGTLVIGRTAGTVLKMPARGGTPEEVTALDPARQETGHTNPRLLPDHRHFLYLRGSSIAGNSGIFVGSLDQKPGEQSRERLIATTSNALFVNPGSGSSIGHVLYVNDGVLMAQRFNPQTLALVGESATVADGVAVGPPGYVHASVSSTGMLAYERQGSGAGGVPTWFDRTGRERGTVGDVPVAHALYPRLSPDGKRVALVIDGDLWVYELDGRPARRLTNDRTSYASPVWTPDGQSLVAEGRSLQAIAADGSATTPKTVSKPGHFHPHGWSPDGRQLLVASIVPRDPMATWDLLMLPYGTTGDGTPVVATPAAEGLAGASLSPNKRFLAYASDTTGTLEIWVRPYPGPGAPERISPRGGTEPIWSRDGRELVYLEGNRFMSVKTTTDGAFTFSSPTLLFELSLARGSQPPLYDLAADGRILALKAGPNQVTPIDIVMNWRELLAGGR